MVNTNRDETAQSDAGLVSQDLDDDPRLRTDNREFKRAHQQQAGQNTTLFQSSSTVKACMGYDEWRFDMHTQQDSDCPTAVNHCNHKVPGPSLKGKR